MEARGRRSLFLIAFLSGIPALASQVVWTREIALTAGSESEAMGLVVALFFTGLALGSALLGPVADRSPAPLRWYGKLEAGVGVALVTIAVASLTDAAADLSESFGMGRRLGAAIPILPTTFLMGGTMPALLRHAAPRQVTEARDVGADSGRLVALNTGGAVFGVSLSMLSIPLLGLRASLVGAGLTSLAVGMCAILIGQRKGAPTPLVAASHCEPNPPPTKRTETSNSRLPIAITLTGMAGISTLGFEVILGRSTALALGSSLYAWALVLMLTLSSLSLGYALGGRNIPAGAKSLRRAAILLLFAATAMMLTPIALGHHPTNPSGGLSPVSIFRAALSIVPAMMLMGMTFPLFVVWGVRESHRGRDFGLLASINTAGGVVGSLAAGFWVLPMLGPVQAFGFVAVVTCATGLFAAMRTMSLLRNRSLYVAMLLFSIATVWVARNESDPSLRSAVLSIDHGRRATTIVRRTPRSRELIVDGEPEASTFGRARRTEQLLAALPFIMHPNPDSFLELGLGSGITLATAVQFGPKQVDCVEIAPSVLRAQKFFAPANGAGPNGLQSKAHIALGDARSFLRNTTASYDIVVANTAQPWSIQATGLYSIEYYKRIRGALAENGIAAQWLPYHQIPVESLAEILQTFFATFDHGGLWWGDGSLFLLGSNAPLSAPDPIETARRLSRAGLTTTELGLGGIRAFSLRHVANAQIIRDQLRGTATLSDDRPRLEGRRAWGSSDSAPTEALSLLLSLATTQSRNDPTARPIALFIESLRDQARGETDRAERIQGNLAIMGLALGDAEILERGLRRVDEALQRSDVQAARAILDGFDQSKHSAGRYELAEGLLALRKGDDAMARRMLESSMNAAPHDPHAPSMLGELLAKTDLAAAERAFEEALRRDPYSIRALAASGLLRIAQNDLAGATLRLESLVAISPLGERPETIGLKKAIARYRSRHSAH